MNTIIILSNTTHQDVQTYDEIHLNRDFTIEEVDPSAYSRITLRQLGMTSGGIPTPNLGHCDGTVNSFSHFKRK